MVVHSGVYQIINLTTRECYVGSTKHFQHRENQHWSELSLNKHTSPKLQGWYNEHGKSDLRFSALEYIEDISCLREREQYWIDLLHPAYNTLTVVNSMPHAHMQDPIIRKQISEAVKKLWRDGKYSHKIGMHYNWKAGIPNRKGVKLSDETKDKIRQATLGEKNPNYGKPRSEETKMKQSLGHTKPNKYPGAISPDGTIYAPINNMSAFCREHDLTVSQMIALMHTRVKSHKGWTLYKG